MKTKKSILLIAACIFFAQLLLAVAPEKKSSKNLAANLLKEITKDVNLTDSQKVVIIALSSNCELSVRETLKESSIELKKLKHRQAMQKYREALDNILTQNQKDTLMVKTMQRSFNSFNQSK